MSDTTDVPVGFMVTLKDGWQWPTLLDRERGELVHAQNPGSTLERVFVKRVLVWPAIQQQQWPQPPDARPWPAGGPPPGE